MNKKVRKGLDIGAIVLVVIIFLLGAAILSLTLTKRADGVPRIFGVTFLDIQTESMEGTINAGDVAVITKVKKEADLKVDDVITFWDMIDINEDGKLDRVLNTHRIVEINAGASASDPVMFVTKGDNTLDQDVRNKVMNDIIGRYNFRIPNLGHFVRFLQSIWGFLIVIILPLVAFLGYRIYILVKVILQMKKEKQIENGTDPDLLKAEVETLRAKLASFDSEVPKENKADELKKDNE